MTRPVFCWMSGRPPSALQPIAEVGGAAILPDDGVVRSGSPVSRSQTMVVSRWLVMPMAAMSRALQRRSAERLDGDTDLRRPDLLRRRARPTRLRKDLCEFLLCHATMPPS